MNLTTNADRVMMFCILASMAIFDAFSTLFSILKKGIFIDQRSILMKKTNRELKAMLVGVEKISKLNKSQLVDLLLDKNVIHWCEWIWLTLNCENSSFPIRIPFIYIFQKNQWFITCKNWIVEEIGDLFKVKRTSSTRWN